MDVAESLLHSLGMLNELPQGSFRLFLEGLGSIVLNGSLCVGNQLQIAVPIIQIEHAAKEDKPLIAIVGANALHLVLEKSFVKLDNPLFQLAQDCLDVLAGGNVVLVQEMFGEGAVPVHSGDDMGDAGKVGFRRLRRILENLEAS
jgi:hypothetical protein